MILLKDLIKPNTMKLRDKGSLSYGKRQGGNIRRGENIRQTVDLQAFSSNFTGKTEKQMLESTFAFAFFCAPSLFIIL